MPFVTRLPALTGADPYPDALLVLDFVGARRGPQYYKALGVTTADITKIPGWTYTGGASTGSYAAKADGSLQLFAQNVPRITDAGYDVWESRTNLLLRSQEFDNASWGAGAVTVTANAITAPDGTLTADKVVPSTATSVHQLLQSVTHTAAGYTISVYAKPSGYDRIAIRENTTSGAYVVASLTGAGSILANSVGTSTVTAAADGWYRLTMTWTAAAVSQQMAFYVIGPGYTSGSPHSYTWAGDGTSGVYFWGAQDELGSFATPPIPTTSVAVTRAADVGSVNNLTVPSAGTAFAEGVWPPSAQNVRIIGVNGGSVTLLHAAPTGVGIFNGTTALVATPAPTSGAIFRGASTWTASGRSVVTNANTVATDANTQPATTRIDVGWEGGNTAHTLNAPIRRIVIYPRAMSNSELQAITTAGAY